MCIVALKTKGAADFSGSALWCYKKLEDAQ
jgi:hypothetical protein